MLTAGNRFPKTERLCSGKAITALFADGQSGFCFPYRYLVVTKEASPAAPAGAAVLISVAKRLHKRAVRRNLLKRRTREAWRLHKSPLIEACTVKGLRVEIALIYISKEAEPYSVIENGITKILERISEGL